MNFMIKNNLHIDSKTEKWKTKFNPENYKAKNFSEEVIDAKTGKVVIKLGDKDKLSKCKKVIK